MYKFWMVVFFLCLNVISVAQDSLHIRQWMDSLAAPAMKGRGYVGNGMQLAADWICATMERKGVQVQRQSFEYPVNVFPKQTRIVLNGKQLVEGVDFLMGPESGSFNGTVSLLQVDSSLFTSPDQKVVLELVNKLTWSVATHQQQRSRVMVVRQAIKSQPKELVLQVEPFFEPSFTAYNVIATIPGTQRNDSAIVFTAHYDHLGQMGNALFAGANDNASGAALLMQLACRIQAQPLPYKAVFIWFAGEEAGLVGSAYHVSQPIFPLSKIRFLLNLDLMGSGEEGITVVNATEFEREFKLLQEINKAGNFLVAINSRGKAPNSDHYFFSEKGVPAFFWYTLGPRKSYHDIDDIASTVSLYEAADLVQLAIQFSEQVILLPRK